MLKKKKIENNFTMKTFNHKQKKLPQWKSESFLKSFIYFFIFFVLTKQTIEISESH